MGFRLVRCLEPWADLTPEASGCLCGTVQLCGTWDNVPGAGGWRSGWGTECDEERAVLNFTPQGSHGEVPISQTFRKNTGGGQRTG